jgi:hypothetical protein
MSTTTLPPVPFETCDRHPSANAAVLVEVSTGQLAFCAHCARKHNDALAALGADAIGQHPAFDLSSGYLDDSKFKTPDPEPVHTYSSEEGGINA